MCFHTHLQGVFTPILRCFHTLSRRVFSHPFTGVFTPLFKVFSHPFMSGVFTPFLSCSFVTRSFHTSFASVVFTFSLSKEKKTYPSYVDTCVLVLHSPVYTLYIPAILSGCQFSTVLDTVIRGVRSPFTVIRYVTTSISLRHLHI